MTDKKFHNNNLPDYSSPKVKVVNIAPRNRILQSSLYSSPGLNSYGDGSSSNYGFGDED